MASTTADKRKMSESMETTDIKETILNLRKEADIEEISEDYEMENVARHAEEIVAETVEELASKNKALQLIQSFLEQANVALKKSYAELLKENKALKDVIKNDFQLDYKYIKKDYE